MWGKKDIAILNSLSLLVVFPQSITCRPPPGPRGSCGHAVFPPLWHGGRPYMSVRLPGRLQRSLPFDAEAGSFLRDVPARGSHLYLQHHDVRDGVGWRHWRKRLSGFLQCGEATYGRCGYPTSIEKHTPGWPVLLRGFSGDNNVVVSTGVLICFGDFFMLR